MKKWYNVKISWNTRNAIERAENFREWLDDNMIRCKVNAAGADMLNFEIELEQEQVDKVNAALDRIVWPDAIGAI